MNGTKTKEVFLFHTDCTEPNKKYDETDTLESVYSNEKSINCTDEIICVYMAVV